MSAQRVRSAYTLRTRSICGSWRAIVAHTLLDACGRKSHSAISFGVFVAMVAFRFLWDAYLTAYQMLHISPLGTLGTTPKSLGWGELLCAELTCSW